ncbi:DUF4382 domain-containing protein [Marinobacter salicampi]|uniref:DUF4382 domain-containing protein n=1 Tax=Marinobacter salicampi TaxID=435907 RepID=UPI00140BDA93|nr:DUF4382 domain-containing protein [Marinobacter salicampi]
MKYALVKGLSVAALAAAISACGGSGSDSGSTGTLSLGLTDAPVTSLSQANLNITSVEVKPSEGESVTIELAQPLDINLLDFQGGKVAQLFEGQEFPAGQYQWIRLHLGEDPYVVEASDVNETPVFLFLPSGRQTGLKLNGGFVIPAGGSADFTIDFDVKKSIFNAGANAPAGQDKYMLKPSHRLINNVEAGSIVGDVDVIGITDPKSPYNCNYDGSVYVYEGSDVTPTDLDLTNTEVEGPVVAVPVTNEEQASLFSFKAAFLPAGEYTIAYSCQTDDNETSEPLEFIGTQNVSLAITEDDAEATAEIIQ